MFLALERVKFDDTVRVTSLSSDSRFSNLSGSVVEPL